MESYLQGQDLCKIIASGETTPPENAKAFWKWKIKTGNALFKEEVLEHIRRVCKHTKCSMGHTCDTIFKEK